MSARHSFLLTRRAALDLRDIYNHSTREWGEAAADNYMKLLYSAMSNAAKNPEIGMLRSRRTAPFSMIPAGKHFVVYHSISGGVAILSILHQVRDIESLLVKLSPSFLRELAKFSAPKVGKNTKPRRR